MLNIENQKNKIKKRKGVAIKTYGSVTGSNVGVVMKEAVRRAINAISNERFAFEAQAKLGKTGKMDDVVTSADKRAQESYVKILLESFPTFGIVAEEENLSIPCTEPGRKIWWTVDPLDGTRAFIRRQSSGIGTQVALVEDGEVIAACVGDVMTREMFYFRPDSEKIHRLSGFEIPEDLSIDPKATLTSQYLLLRDRPKLYSEGANKIIDSMFKKCQTADGSIGLSMARLWKGEFGGKILEPGLNTPWDFCPVLGISKKLGFEFFSIDPVDGSLTWLKPLALPTNQKTSTETLIIHSSRVEEISQRFAVKNT